MALNTDNKGRPEMPGLTEKCDYRILLASDIHNNNVQEWYGVSNASRMEQFIAAVWAEHREQPIDLLLFLGDYSLDHWASGGSVLGQNKSFAADFVDSVVARLPAGIPMFFLPGNHEQYGEEEWVRITGNSRSGVVALGKHVFIMLDTFAGGLQPAADHDGEYTGLDMPLLKDTLDKYPGARVYLCAHYFDVGIEGEKLQRLFSDYGNIAGLFMGHTHYADVVELGRVCKGLTIAQTGNFSYGNGGSTETENFFWGFRDLVITGDSAVSRYILAKAEAVIQGECVRHSRQLISTVNYA